MYSSNISSTDDILRRRFVFTRLPAYIAGLFEAPPAKSMGALLRRVSGSGMFRDHEQTYSLISDIRIKRCGLSRVRVDHARSNQR